MLRKAKEHAKKVGASFIITGEVLGERPMSQHRKALEVIEKKSGLEGLILRPLSAKLLPETEIEKKGIVNRDRLLDISGRSRKRQIQLAKHLRIKGYACPAGGCLLTDKNFANRLRDLFRTRRNVTTMDVELLKIGRHFRYGSSKIVVGRNEDENNRLLHLKKRSDFYLEVSRYGSPITVVQGQASKKTLEIAASLTAYFSDCKDVVAPVMYGKAKLNKKMRVPRISEEDVTKLRV